MEYKYSISLQVYDNKTWKTVKFCEGTAKYGEEKNRYLLDQRISSEFFHKTDDEFFGEQNWLYDFHRIETDYENEFDSLLPCEMMNFGPYSDLVSIKNKKFHTCQYYDQLNYYYKLCTNFKYIYDDVRIIFSTSTLNQNNPVQQF